jgi:phenylpropionate dioxygenase-like ring-hydroxylating dioxygenase large terminal subunit
MESAVVHKIREELADVAAAAPGTSMSMSPPYYTSPDFLKLEEELLFRKEWVCLGHEGEVASPGDYFTTELVGEQLIVLRTRTGTVSVLSNVCRHRGNLIITGSGNSRRFTCPYHAWTYDDEGKLLAAPRMDAVEGFDKRDMCLPSFKCEIWMGFIYVNLSGDAAPLAPRLEALEPMIRNYELSKRRLAFATEEVWKTNWKCLAENFMEGYHLSPMHPRTLHPYTPTELCVKGPSGDYFTTYWANHSASWPELTNPPENLTAEEAHTTPMFWVAPNHVVAVSPLSTLYLCLRPNGAGEVAIRWGTVTTLSHGDSDIERHVKFCQMFNEEDRVKLEDLQMGLQSQYLGRSFLAPEDFEGTIRDMNAFVARRLAAGAASAVGD